MRKELLRACDERCYVTVVRRKGWEEFEGYVAAVGKEWFALVNIPRASFEGLVMLRIKDVRALATPPRPKRAKRALKLDGMWPPAVPDLLDLDSTRGLLFSAGSLSRTLAAANERRTWGYFVAHVERITQRRLESHEVTPSGRWGHHLTIDHGLLTKVVLWDPYVERVTAIADAGLKPRP